MGAIEGTIVSTAMPAIAGDLGGFSLYSWVFSAYLLMYTVTVLIYGKLSDLFGRKPVINFGITMFLIGSLLCGLAESMQMLVIFRLIQGFGAGAVTSIATTIVGDIYSKEERAKIQGYLSSVWGISAILGPALARDSCYICKLEICFLAEHSAGHFGNDRYYTVFTRDCREEKAYN